MQKSSLAIGLIVVCLIFAGSVTAADNSSKITTNWYGFVKLDASFDQNLTSHGNFVMWVEPESADKNNAQYNLPLRNPQRQPRLPNASRDEL